MAEVIHLSARKPIDTSKPHERLPDVLTCVEQKARWDVSLFMARCSDEALARFQDFITDVALEAAKERARRTEREMESLA